MKKIVRLTESDLVRLVKRIIKEDLESPTAKNGNIIIDGEVWELWAGWVKIEVLSLKQLSNGDLNMKYDTSLTDPGEGIVTNRKFKELESEKNKGKTRIEFEVETVDKNGNKNKKTLTLIKK